MKRKDNFEVLVNFVPLISELGTYKSKGKKKVLSFVPNGRTDFEFYDLFLPPNDSLNIINKKTGSLISKFSFTTF